MTIAKLANVAAQVDLLLRAARVHVVHGLVGLALARAVVADKS
jgi:hypothetical protein